MIGRVAETAARATDEATSAAASYQTARLERMYRDLWRIRRFEERAKELFSSGAIKGTAHSCVGQEAIAVGACVALREDDFIVSHHRGHGHCIAKGADTTRMMAELFGRETGYGRGLGGSMHIAALDRGVLGANGIVGAGLGIGAGAGLSAQVLGTDRVCVAFFGDGAANEGIFHEAMNLAGLWKLPLIFLCENNRYGLSLGVAEASAEPRLSLRAAGYGMPGERIDGNDALAVAASVAKAVARARAGEGPSLIEALTYRWGDHSMRANLPRYRPEAEERHAREHEDPIVRLAAVLETRQLGAAELSLLKEEAEREIAGAIEAAEAAAEPSFDILVGAVSVAHAAPGEPEPASERKLSYVEAIREAMDQEMARDERVMLMGEDVGRIGGLFACSVGLQEKHGRSRVRDTPISENVLVNAAVGAAMTGLRPIVEVQFFDFITHMMDGLVNQAAKLRFMLGGAAPIPLVVRGPQGGGIRLGAQHSQSLETWFAHVPGLVVIAPATPFDAKGLLASAVRDDNPVVFIEHKLLYTRGREPVPEAPYVIPIGKAKVKRQGGDVTIVATMAMVEPALAAARVLADEGLEAEVIDPRTIRPLDTETILASVRKTHHCVVAHEGWKTHGFGAEVAAMVMEEAFDYLDAPVERVGMAGVPMPYNANLEKQAMPAAGEIVEAARRACDLLVARRRAGRGRSFFSSARAID
jgi:2-oxoisovalerate dehydrogenase E1 component